MRSKLILVFFLAMIAGCWDAAVVSWFEFPLSIVRVSLVCAVLWVLFSARYEKSIVWAVVSGVVADMFLPSDGWIAFRSVIAIVSVYILARFVFTNRSIWGICFLGSVAVFVDRLLLWGIQYIPKISGEMRTIEVHPSIWFELIWMCLACSCVFICMVAFSKRFHPTLSRSDQMNRVPWN